VSAGQRALALLFALALFVELSIAVLGSALHALDTEGPTVGAAFGSPEQIGQLFLTKFLLPFEVASFLLLIAAVGAVVLARRRGGIDEEEAQRLSLMDFSRPLTTGTMAEGVGAPITRGREPRTLGAELAEPEETPSRGGAL